MGKEGNARYLGDHEVFKAFFGVVKSSHSSVVRALDLKTRGCGFDSRAGKPNNY